MVRRLGKQLMAAEPVRGLQDFARQLDIAIRDPDGYPLYAVLLYQPMNGLDQRLHEYVVSRWRFLNSLTGPSWLLFALEDIDRARSIEDFRPEEVYDIARHLGASVASVPGIVFFTEPEGRRDTLVLTLGEFLPRDGDVTDSDITDFFRSLSSIVDSCSAESPHKRLKCLDQRLTRDWPRESSWEPTARSARGWVVSSLTDAATIAQAIQAIATAF
jgi:hypothetical protein